VDCLDLLELLETGDHLEISRRSLDLQDLRGKKETRVCLELMALMGSVGKEASLENRANVV